MHLCVENNSHCRGTELFHEVVRFAPLKGSSRKRKAPCKSKRSKFDKPQAGSSSHIYI